MLAVFGHNELDEAAYGVKRVSASVFCARHVINSVVGAKATYSSRSTSRSCMADATVDFFYEFAAHLSVFCAPKVKSMPIWCERIDWEGTGQDLEVVRSKPDKVLSASLAESATSVLALRRTCKGVPIAMLRHSFPQSLSTSLECESERFTTPQIQYAS